MINIGIIGASGRMGQTLLRLIQANTGMTLAAVIASPNSLGLGQPAGALIQQPGWGPRLTADPSDLLTSDVVIDFSTPATTQGLLQLIMREKKHLPRLIIGTTGMSASQELLIQQYACDQAVVYAANYSLGMNLLSWLAGRAAASLPAENFDIEIFETHHNQKVDAPSGTALMLGQSAAQGRGIDLDAHKVSSRDGNVGTRKAGDIGFSVARGGDVAGEHTVFFFGQQERLELTHRATDRAIFARGALRAATWIINQPPGQYDMQNVLGLKVETI